MRRCSGAFNRNPGISGTASSLAAAVVRISSKRGGIQCTRFRDRPPGRRFSAAKLYPSKTRIVVGISMLRECPGARGAKGGPLGSCARPRVIDRGRYLGNCEPGARSGERGMSSPTQVAEVTPFRLHDRTSSVRVETEVSLSYVVPHRIARSRASKANDACFLT